MADRRKDSDKSKAESPQPTKNTNLQTPIDLPELAPPNSTSFLKFSLRNLTPRLSTTDQTLGSKTNPQTPAMNLAQSKFDPWTPSPDIHNKPLPEPARKSKTTRAIGMARTIDAAKRLNRVMGLSAPEPFVTPPAMPKDLEKEFGARLEEYGLDNRMQSMALDMLSQVAGMQERLPEIMEENENPVQSAWTPPQSGQKKGLPGQSFVPLSEAQSTPCKDAKKPVGDPQPSTSGHSAGMSDAEIEALMNEPPQSLEDADQQAFASSPPQMMSQGHEPDATASGSSEARDLEGATLVDGSQPLYGSHDTLSFAAFRKEMDAFEEQHVPAHSYGSTSGNTSGYGNMFGAARKPLFPSPHVEAQFEGKGKGKQPMAPAQATPAATSSTGNAFFENLFRHPPAPSAPHIAIQAPSPTKRQSSKKRLPSQGEDDSPGPALKGSRPDEKKATGLPTLPASSPASQETDVPGHTPALLTILLTWSFAMQSFYRRLPDPKAFRAHASFPFPVTAPMYNHLISVGFYDTSVVPHKEIRFLGPGDAAEVGYAEVYVFRSKEERAAFEKQEQEFTKLEAMKKKLGLRFGYADADGKAARSQEQMHLANSGEGRWAYILIKGHAKSPEEVAPHVMLAWHISGVTDTSSCLYTVFPDTDKPVPSHLPTTPTPSKQSLRRFASLQNLVSANRGQKHLHREIRSASSSSELPQVDVSSIEPQEGALTLKRTVIKLEKAGSLPLIEGHRVDVGEFRGWSDAVGRGEGKVIVWRE